MLRTPGFGRLCLLAGGLGIGMALATTPGDASGDSSSDYVSSVDQLLAGLSVLAADPAQALDMQIAIGGTLLFPSVDNTAFAMATPGNIAIAIGDNSYASAQTGLFDFAFAHGTNGFAEADSGNFDVAVADGADRVAKAGLAGESIGLTSFDAAVVFRDGSEAFAVSMVPTVSAFSTWPPPSATICWRRLPPPPSWSTSCRSGGTK